MDSRVGKLEGHVGVLQSDVSQLKEDVSKLKDDVGTLKMDVAVIKSNYVTKEDFYRLDSKIEGLRTELHQSLAMQTKWFASTQPGLLVLGLGLAKLLF